MILIAIIYLPTFAVCCYWIKIIPDLFSSKESQHRPGEYYNKGMVASKSQIREKLDHLSDQYKQGVITREQYYKRANGLIDKLSDKYSDVVWAY